MIFSTCVWLCLFVFRVFFQIPTPNSSDNLRWCPNWPWCPAPPRSPSRHWSPAPPTRHGSAEAEAGGGELKSEEVKFVKQLTSLHFWKLKLVLRKRENYIFEKLIFVWKEICCMFETVCCHSSLGSPFLQLAWKMENKLIRGGLFNTGIWSLAIHTTLFYCCKVKRY